MSAPSMPPVTGRRDLDPGEFRKHGIIAGLVGAALMAAFFLIVDVVRGHPLFTPTLMMRALLEGRARAGAEAAQGSIGWTIAFTVIHALVFAAIGWGVAELLRRFDVVHSQALTLVLFFGALCVAFFGFAFFFAVIGPQAVMVRDAFLGNALAAAGMSIYLGRSLHRRAQ